jgi:hypothetical protein
LHHTKWSNEEKKKGRKPTLHKNKSNNSMEDVVGKEEHGYLVPDPNKTIINVCNEPSDTHKKIPYQGNHGRGHCETHEEDSRQG